MPIDKWNIMKLVVSLLVNNDWDVSSIC
jgi:hypothetical protein